MKKGWQTQPFEDCIEKVTYSSKIQRKDFLNEGAYPVISQENDFINGYWDDEGDLFRVSTPIVVFGDHTKVLKYVDFDFVLGADGVKVLIPREFLLPKYFFYHLQSANLDSLGYARHYRLLKDLAIAYPPLPEQHRIVAILDKAFDGIATAKANAEKNLQNARALFDSHLNAVFSQQGKGWEKKTLDEVCDFRGGGTPSKAVQKFWEGKIPWVSPKDMKSEVISDSIDHISMEAVDCSATSIIPKGSVLIVVRSGILARIVPMAVAGRELTINQDLKALCPKNTIESLFLYNLLESKMPVLLSLVSRGATVHRLITDQIRSLSLWLPPKPEQTHIVKELNLLREETQRLESVYRQKLAALDALKKSLLNQAFTGNL